MPATLREIILANDRPLGAAQRIEDGAVEQRGAVGGHQRHQPEIRAARLLLGVGVGIEAETACSSPCPR